MTSANRLRKLLHLQEGDRILTAYAQSGSGPGWSNAPIWVIIRSSATGILREECIQPKD